MSTLSWTFSCRSRPKMDSLAWSAPAKPAVSPKIAAIVRRSASRRQTRASTYPVGSETKRKTRAEHVTAVPSRIAAAKDKRRIMAAPIRQYTSGGVFSTSCVRKTCLSHHRLSMCLIRIDVVRPTEEEPKLKRNLIVKRRPGEIPTKGEGIKTTSGGIRRRQPQPCSAHRTEPGDRNPTPAPATARAGAWQSRSRVAGSPRGLDGPRSQAP